MKKNYFSKVLLCFMCLLLIPTLYGCKSKDKEIVISENVKADLNSEKSAILELIEEGNIYLNSSNFSEARTSYEKAIAKDKTDVSTYLEIKDNYIKASRFDDAYYIIKLAIDNNVSKDEMSKVLEEIKSNFPAINIEQTAIRNVDFNLPEQVTLPIDTVPNPVTIKWAQNKVDTSACGTFTFDGYSDEYGRTVRLTLTIRDIVKTTKIGYITDIYEQNGNTYIKYDEVEFYRNGDAKREYLKDNSTPSDSGWGNEYYIRNTSKDKKPYILSSACSIKICGFLAIPPVISSNSTDLVTMSRGDFKTYVNEKCKESERTRSLLFWINTEEDIITSTSMQFTP